MSTPEQTRPGGGLEIKGADYIDLYKFFQLRADSIKTSLFQSVTWVVGFAAAILGFVFNKCFDFESTSSVTIQEDFGIVLCSVGGLLCLYGLFLLYDGRNHILGNWDLANQCAAEVPNLEKLTLGQKRRRGGKVWHQMGGVVFLFLLTFAGLIVFFARR
jgi:hypothetical protein